MALCIPETDTNFNAPGERKVFSLLKQLPDSCLVYYEMVIGERDLRPDFVVIDTKRGITIFEVKDWGIDTILKATPTMFKIVSKGNQSRDRMNPEHKIKLYLENIREPLSTQEILCDNKGRLDVEIRYYVVFPNMTKGDFAEASLSKVVNPNFVIFKEDIKNLRENYGPFYTASREYAYSTNSIWYKFYELEWYKVYDFIEFILNRFNPNTIFRASLNKIFREERTSYRLIGNLVMPLTSEIEIKEIEQALKISDKYQPVKDQLEKALALYSKKPEPDSLNSIKESISGLEALARIVLNNPKSTLGDLANKLPIHRAFREALKKIYGWTSDEGGIRHAETGEKIISAEEEARFMLVLSSAFVNYIISKYGK